MTFCNLFNCTYFLLIIKAVGGFPKKKWNYFLIRQSRWNLKWNCIHPPVLHPSSVQTCKQLLFKLCLTRIHKLKNKQIATTTINWSSSRINTNLIWKVKTYTHHKCMFVKKWLESWNTFAYARRINFSI